MPAGITVVFAVILTLIFSGVFNIDFESYSTMCTLLTATTGFTLLYKLCKPLNKVKGTLWFCMILLFIVEITLLKDLFYIQILSTRNIILFVAEALIVIGIYVLLDFLIPYILRKREKINDN